MKRTREEEEEEPRQPRAAKNMKTEDATAKLEDNTEESGLLKKQQEDDVEAKRKKTLEFRLWVLYRAAKSRSALYFLCLLFRFFLFTMRGKIAVTNDLFLLMHVPFTIYRLQMYGAQAHSVLLAAGEEPGSPVVRVQFKEEMSLLAFRRYLAFHCIPPAFDSLATQLREIETGVVTPLEGEEASMARVVQETSEGEYFVVDVKPVEWQRVESGQLVGVGTNCIMFGPLSNNMRSVNWKLLKRQIGEKDTEVRSLVQQLDDSYGLMDILSVTTAYDDRSVNVIVCRIRSRQTGKVMVAKIGRSGFIRGEIDIMKRFKDNPHFVDLLDSFIIERYGVGGVIMPQLLPARNCVAKGKIKDQQEVREFMRQVFEVRVSPFVNSLL